MEGLLPLRGSKIALDEDFVMTAFDPQTMSAALAWAGFDAIASPPVGESAYPELRGIEGHWRQIPPALSAPETFVLEAIKGVGS